MGAHGVGGARAHVFMGMREGGHGFAVFLGALAHDAEVVRGAGGLEVQPALEAAVVDPVHRQLILVRLEHDLFGEFHAAADRHQHEDVQRISAEVQRHLVDGIELLVVVLGDGGVDLDRHAGAAQQLERRDAAVECALDLAEAVVGGSVGAVEAHRDALEADIDDPLGDALVHDRAIGGQSDRQADGGGVLSKVEEVGAHQGLAAGENQDRLAQFAQAGDHAARLGGGEVVAAELLRHVQPAAVYASQVTRGRRLPEQQSQGRRRVGHGSFSHLPSRFRDLAALSYQSSTASIIQIRQEMSSELGM